MENYYRQDCSEYNKIQNILQKYAEAAKYGKAEIVKPYFHEQAVIFGEIDGIKIEGLLNLESLFNAGPAKTSFDFRIDILDLEKSAAVVKALEDGLNGYNFTDIIMLQKINGEWKIVAKIFEVLDKNNENRKNYLSRPDIKEYENVEKNARKFIEGVKNGNADILKPYFHEKASMFGQYDDTIEAGSIQNLYNSLAKVGSCGEDYIARVDLLLVEKNIAVAKVIEDNWAGYKFTDFLAMQKIDGVWKIVAKVYDTLNSQKK